jgi:hypothetical protein
MSRIQTPLFCLALIVPALACTGPNPSADTHDDESTSTETLGDGDGDGDGDSDGDGDGDGDGDTCSDGQKNGDETDVDCGGSCSPCADQDGCATASDCLSSVCSNGICQAPTCADSIQNGDEAGIDCGGPCQLCRFGALATKLDDLVEGDATHPRVAMYFDGSFALAYLGPAQARVRWFSPHLEPSGPSVALDIGLIPASASPTPLVVGNAADQVVHALVVGRTPMANTDSVYLISRKAASYSLHRQINELGSESVYGALTADDSLATLTWRVEDQLLTRRLHLDGGDWVESAALVPDISGMKAINNPAMARNQAGVSVVAWMRCNHDFSTCDVAMRRLDSGWIDPSPVVISGLPMPPANLAVAITEDGRVAVVFSLIGLGETSLAAWISGPDLAAEGQLSILQAAIPGSTEADVLALPDNSFAIAWPDVGEGRVRLRRFLGHGQPTLPELDDESPWGSFDTPRSVALAGVDGRIMVVWSARVDGAHQIHGQMLGH